MNATARNCFINVFFSKARATNAHATCVHMVRQEQLFGTQNSVLSVGQNAVLTS